MHIKKRAADAVRFAVCRREDKRLRAKTSSALRAPSPKGKVCLVYALRQMHLPLWGRWIAEGETDEVPARRRMDVISQALQESQ